MAIKNTGGTAREQRERYEMCRHSETPIKLPTGGTSIPLHSAAMERFRAVLFAFAVALLSTAARGASPNFESVVVEPTKTSIYVGNVALTMSTFHRKGDVFAADYRAKVFPYFFSNEHGQLWITLSDDDLARLSRGEVVPFKGRAENSDKEERRIDGRAVPADAVHGKIKVRVFVTSKIELIFNTTYHFGS